MAVGLANFQDSYFDGVSITGTESRGTLAHNLSMHKDLKEIPYGGVT